MYKDTHSCAVKYQGEMRALGGYLLTGGGDPLTGEFKGLEQERLFAAGGRVVFLVDPALAEAAAAWREVYIRGLGARATGIVVLRGRATAHDRALAQKLAQVPLVWLAGGDPGRVLADLKDTPLARALSAVVAGGGTVGAFGAASGLFGATAAFSRGEGHTFAYGLALLSGAVALPGFDRPGAFEALAEATAAQPDLVGLGLPRGAAVWIDARGEGRVLSGRAARLVATGARVEGASLLGLSVDLLAAGARFRVPVYQSGP